MKMIGDIERGAAQNGCLGKLIPDDFTDGDDRIFFINTLPAASDSW